MSSSDSTTMKGRLLSMLELQHSINSKIRPDWIAANNAWYRAMWAECAELMDHIGWKWWKHQVRDLPQVHLELVDILHFGLSELLQQHGTAQKAVDLHLDSYVAYGHAQPSGLSEADDCCDLVESFAASVLTTRRFDLASFCRLADAVGLTEEAIYEMYVGKNVLNTFRQDHGYKTGEYRKTWDGREDNVWLVEFSAGLEKHPSTFFHELYKRLSQKYEEVSRGD